MKIAIIHDWLTGMRGGEKVLESLCELYPQADIYTLIYEPTKISVTINNLRIYPSILQNFHFIRKKYRYFLPLFPKIIESFDLKKYDLVISSSHCVAKGIIAKTLHISYIYTPMRYAWELFQVYCERYNKIVQQVIKLAIKPIKLWDIKSSKRPNYLIACSEYTRQRIKQYYDRDSVVIYPPVDTNFFVPDNKDENFYLVVSALVPYKKIDLIIKTFNELNLHLVIIGGGSEMKYFKSIANKNITFLGFQPNFILKEYYTKCKALIFAAQEDFGITSIEAQSAGKPVIAYHKGGLKETVIENRTGVFFEEQTIESLKSAILKFQQMQFDKNIIRANALKFSKEIFKQKFKTYLEQKINDYWHRN